MARRERGRLASPSEVGQQTPIVVVGTGAIESFVDGYERVRAAPARPDVVRAAEWILSELESALGGGDASAGPWRSPAWMQEKTRRNQR